MTAIQTAQWIKATWPLWSILNYVCMPYSCYEMLTVLPVQYLRILILCFFSVVRARLSCPLMTNLCEFGTTKARSFLLTCLVFVRRSAAQLSSVQFSWCAALRHCGAHGGLTGSANVPRITRCLLLASPNAWLTDLGLEMTQTASSFVYKYKNQTSTT